MLFHRKPWFRNAKIAQLLTLTILAALILSGCGLSLAGDVTPPPNYNSNQPLTKAGETSVPNAEVVFPIVPPDPAQGAAIYAEKCLPCHGAKGMGDGPQSANLPNPPAAIGSADFAANSKPVDWFNVVTNGNLEKFMPGFTSLDDRQRWDVISYVYSLSMSQDQLAQGKTLYNAKCASCHGETGQGDGPQALSLTTKPASWSDQSLLAKLSTNDMVQLIQSGTGAMPAYQGQLDTAQSVAVAYYLRSLSFAGAGGNAVAEAGATPPAGETPAAGATSTAPKDIVISGKVTNATPGGKLPQNMKANVLAYNGMTPAFNLSTDVAVDGSYKFDQVQFDPTYVYFVQVEANGLSFNSDILHGQDITGVSADVPVKIYETSTDTSQLRADRLHVFFDFAKPGIVQVINLYIISNPTDKVIVTAQPNQPLITFDLPVGATNLQFQDGQLGDRYIQTEKGFADTQPVEPGAGQHQILFAYDLPYSNKLSFSMQPPMPVDAAIVMVPPGVKLNSSQLTDSGQQDVQGTSFHMYQSAKSLQVGDTLALSISGNPGAGEASGTNPLNYILIGAGAFGLVLIGAGLWLYRQRSHAQPALIGEGADVELLEIEEEPEESSEAILEAIVALDDLHAAGSLPEIGLSGTPHSVEVALE